MVEVKIVIPTAGRAKSITTHLAVANAIVCCPESEKEEYAKTVGTTNIDAHPDSIKGLAAKRQWIYDKYKNIFMMDDDIREMRRHTYKFSERYKLRADESHDIIQMGANLAKMAGCVLFGFNHYKHPKHFTGHDPFRLKGFVNALGMGLLEEGHDKLKFNLNIRTNNDFYIAGLNAFYFRKVWVDRRYYFEAGAQANMPGGSTGIRSRSTEADDLKILQACFGKSVIEVKPLSTGGARARHETSKRLVLPY